MNGKMNKGMSKSIEHFILLTLLAFIFQGCEFSKAKREFDDNFDLELTGRVVDVKLNQYGQKLVCLEIIESNYQDYFPIHNPNKYIEDNKETWEKRFFIKVQNNKAVFIFNDEREYRHITHHIAKGAIITINENNNKSFRVYDELKNKNFGGLSILTYPIRDNIENSCLSKM